ncbi:uncharacterized protein LOC111048775 isoform X3 [Nilaparvata lugens]|uniref:uncharacterized protein LOC111048775 isoform X3 n=1 Tax=Nilaparvata lugens TaxID=108931 RepID=UPI00193D0443|nr:uncharacterized protein LOC111048775 isoform X3 [Nilaparvata lugens]
MSSSASETEHQFSDNSFDRTSLSKSNIDVDELNKIIDIDHVLDLHDNLLKKDCEVIRKIKDLYVCVDWEVPISHHSLRFNKSSELQDEMSVHGQSLKLTCFTDEEDQCLKGNWESFKKEYGFDDPKYFLPGYLKPDIFRNEEKHKFVQYLGQGLPQRTLRSIYDRFYEIYAEESVGRFTYVEDQIIRAVKYSQHPYFQKHKKLKVLFELLGRKKVPLIRRYKLLTKDGVVGGPSAPVNWSLDRCKKLVKLLMKKADIDDSRADVVTALESIELDCRDWKEIAKKLGVNWYHVCFFWKTQLSQLICASTCISRNKLRSFLIIWFLSHEEIESFDEIYWMNVAVDLSAPPFICQSVFLSMVTTYVPEKLWINFRGKKTDVS